MSRKVSMTAAALASAAAFSMMATPAVARDYGWGGGWGGGWGRHNDRIDAGDVIAGILIIGGIAAIASAASKAGKSNRQDQRYPDNRDYRDYRQGDDRADYGRADRGGSDGRDGNGINSAVNRCMDEIDRGKARVDSVDSVSREADGWRVQGQVQGEGNFTCTVDGEGRIRQVSINGHAV